MFCAFLVLAASANTIWYVLPLSAAISLVYSASRYELTTRIVRRSSRLFVTITGFMACALGVLWLLSMNI
jgi:hypothetical protein